MRLLRPLTIVAAAATVAACAADAPTVPVSADLAASAARAASPAALNEALAAARAATARYHRVEAAVADGYQLASDCVAVPGVGGMGYHYARFDQVDFALDPAQPEVLVYAPRANGELQLVAVEYMAPGVGARPQLFGATFQDGPPGSGTYALHAWVWKHNPSGMLAPFNPDVACPVADVAAAAEHAQH